MKVLVAVLVICVAQILCEDIRLDNLDPPEAQQLIESKDQSLKYAPKVDSNVPATRFLGNEPHQVLEDIYLANQYHGQDGLGGYLYGYSVPDIAKTEKKKAGGDLRGAYNYISGDGQEIKVEYWDDGNGFHQIDNVPKILPKQIDDSPEVKAAKDEHARIWAEEAERNSKPIQNPYPNAHPGAYAGLGAGVGAGVGAKHAGAGGFGQQSGGSGASGHNTGGYGQQGQGGGFGQGGSSGQGGFGQGGSSGHGGGFGQAGSSGQGGFGQGGFGQGGSSGQGGFGQSGSSSHGGGFGQGGNSGHGGGFGQGGSSGQGAFGQGGNSGHGGSSGQGGFGQSGSYGQQGGAFGKPNSGFGQQGGSGSSGQQGGAFGKPNTGFGGSSGQHGGGFGLQGGAQPGFGQSGQGSYQAGGHGSGAAPQGHAGAYGTGSGTQGGAPSGTYGSPSSSTYNKPAGYQGSGFGVSSSNLNQVDYTGQYSEAQKSYARNPQQDGEDDGQWKPSDEEKGPPKGFFYNVDYPVGIIVSKGNQAGQQKRESLTDVYNTNKSLFEQQLKGGAAVNGGSSYPNYQVHA